MKTLAKLLVLVALLSGCASTDYVQDQIKPLNVRLAALENRIMATEVTLTAGGRDLEANGKRLDEVKAELAGHGDRLDRHEAAIEQISRTAQEALERASAAGKLIDGKLAYEVVLSEDKVKFAFRKTQLNKAAMLALDDFIARIKVEQKPVFIEVQGHTDSIGSEAVNLRVGQQRADAVRLYLHEKGRIPLHRLSAISYGERLPVATNMYRDGRAQNRRVVLVVLY